MHVVASCAFLWLILFGAQFTGDSSISSNCPPATHSSSALVQVPSQAQAPSDVRRQVVPQSLDPPGPVQVAA